jgi:trk system potassium uptake protein TrkA
MRIVIVGAGQVGYHLADQLSHLDQDVVVIDTDTEKVELIADRLDVLALVGNGASVPILEEAGVGKADLFLAVTNRDEVNILGCLAAERLGRARKVARISNPDFIVERSVLSTDQLGIDLMINPERECAWETYLLLASQVASELISFADGKVFLVGLKVHSGAPVAGRTIMDLADELENRYTTVAIHRDGETEIPNGRSRIEAFGSRCLFAEASDHRGWERRGRAPRGVPRCGRGGVHDSRSGSAALRRTVDPAAERPGPAWRRDRCRAPRDGGRGGDRRLRLVHQP